MTPPLEPTPTAAAWRDDPGHLAVLTGLRGWAAIWVFLFHAWTLAGPRRLTVDLAGVTLDLTPFFSIGWAGVPIFFLLSGFLLALPFAQWRLGERDRPDLARYFRRRVARVFPAYYAQLALLLIVPALVFGQGPSLDPAALAKHLAMWFVPPPLGAEPLNGVWWTLPVEFSFYLVLPLLSLFLRPERWGWLLLGGLATMWAWRHGVVTMLVDAPIQARVVAASQLPGSLDSFVLGMLAALAYARHRVGLTRPWLETLAVSGLVVMVLAIYWMHYNYRQYWADQAIFYLWTPFFGLGVTALILAAAWGASLPRRLFGNRVMVLAGLISYSLYLWHLPLLDGLGRLAFAQFQPGYKLPWLLLVTVPTLVLLASLSYRYVERPFMRAADRSKGRPSSPA